jgi:hypothetical protein
MLLLLALLLQADPVVDAVVREGRENPRVMEHLDHLVNKIGPRLTSSTRLEQACEWTRASFAGWGLEARLEEWGSFPVGFDRGPWSARMTSPEPLDLVIGTPAWSAGTDGPLDAPALLAPTTDEELEKLKERLKGAWIVSKSRGPDKYQSAYDEAGAAGVIRSAPKELILTSGRSQISWNALPRRVSIQMIASQHAKLVELLTAGKEVRLTIDVKNVFRKGPVKLHNVLADLKGAEKPDEIVIVGGHLDSWDGATGTTDNGTGVATTMEAARLLAKAGAKPKRTIRFMLWSGEEQGLLGSRAWIKANPQALPKISAVIVHDGGTNYLSGINATEAMLPLFEKAFEPAVKLDPAYPFTVRKVPRLPRGIGSDHDAYLAAGVPGFYWHQSRTAEKGQTYSREHHTQNDVYSAAIPEFQRHSALIVAIGAWRLANLEGMVPRDGITAGPAPADARRLLGVQCDDDLTVNEVSPESPAEKAGIKAGDRIVRIAGKTVSDLVGMRQEIQLAPKETSVRVSRAGKEFDLPVAFPK